MQRNTKWRWWIYFQSVDLRLCKINVKTVCSSFESEFDMISWILLSKPSDVIRSNYGGCSYILSPLVAIWNIDTFFRVTSIINLYPFLTEIDIRYVRFSGHPSTTSWVILCSPLCLVVLLTCPSPKHDDVIKWKHFPRYWPFVRGIHRWIPAQRPVTRSFDAFFDLRLNKRLSKQSRGWWFETPSSPW